MTTASFFENSMKSPPLTLLALEPVRALIEFVGSNFADESALPKGDGHPVIVFPGLATNGLATCHFRKELAELGYAVYDWEQGLNKGPQGGMDEWLETLAQQLKAVYKSHRKPVSLIGWSLGGIYARELAKKYPKLVRQVITLGTPFAGDAASTNAGTLFTLLNGQEIVIDEALLAQIKETPPVPTTSVYSRTDGVVAWGGCLQETTAKSESVEVPASHFGMVLHSRVLEVVADRLAQKAGRWKHFQS